MLRNKHRLTAVILASVALAILAPEPTTRTVAQTTPDLAKRTVGVRGPMRAVQSYSNLPMSFEANAGLSDPSVKFLSRGSGFALFLTGNEAVLSLQRSSQKSKIRNQQYENRIAPRWPLSSPASPGFLRSADASSNPAPTDRRPRKPTTLRMRLVGSNAAAKVVGFDELPGKSNYFIGNNPKKWRTNVPSYAKVKYENVYPDVDLVYYGNQQQLEYDFVVARGGDPKAIRLDLRGAAKLSVDSQGDLVLAANAGSFRFHKPLVYQPAADNGQGARVEGHYVLKSKTEVGFSVGFYDQTKPLVIDPVLSYSTFLGGSALDYGFPIAVDSSGNVYVAGNTQSVDFPVTAGAFQTACGGTCARNDAFVAKINAAGSALVYATYLGGSRNDIARGLAVDAQGEAYIAGTTNSGDFPTTPGAFQTSCPSCGISGPSVFVTKLNPTGSSLVYSTYLGGTNGLGEGRNVVIDGSGHAFVAGLTEATDFPVTPGAFQTASKGGTCGIAFPFPCDHGFVSELNATGSALVYSTYLGGSGEDIAWDLALDGSGNVYVAGLTNSTDFPTTPGAFQTVFGGESPNCDTSVAVFVCGDAFVTKLNPTGSATVYSTYLGGSGDETAGFYGIAVDSSGSAYVTGTSNSTDFPVTPGAFQTTARGGTCGFAPNTFPCDDVFVTKLDGTGAAVLYSTYLGGSGDDYAEGVAVDSSGNAYLLGASSSPDFPLQNPIQSTGVLGNCGTCYDAVVSELNASASGLLFSTYLGGSLAEQGNAIALDSSNNIYVVGITQSADFPTTSGALQILCGGTCGVATQDAFVAKISPNNGSAATLSPWALTYANQKVGTSSSPLTITLRDMGTTAFTVDSITIGGANPGDFSQTNTCGILPAQVAGGEDCVFSVTFTPTAGGARSASLAVTDTAAGSPHVATLTGTGVFVSPPEPIIAGQPTTFVFPASSQQVQYPSNVVIPPGTTMVATATPMTTTDFFNARLAGSQFLAQNPNTRCIINPDSPTSSSGSCVVFEDKCFDTTMSPITCPTSPQPNIIVSTTINNLPTTPPSLVPLPTNPGFLTADDNQNDWVNIFTGMVVAQTPAAAAPVVAAALSNTGDPLTIKGRTTGFNSDFVAVDLGPDPSVGAGTFMGFQSPLRPKNGRVFTRGTAIPVKFQVTDASKQFITNVTAKLAVALEGNPPVEEPVSPANGKGIAPNQFLYDSKSNNYEFYLSTAGYAAGNYTLTVFSNSFPAQVVTFTLQ